MDMADIDCTSYFRMDWLLVRVYFMVKADFKSLFL